METIILDPVLTATEIEEKPIVEDKSILTMSTGVQFKIKPISQSGLASISERYSRTKPRPPVHFVESKGRDEVNESDPDYLDDFYSWQTSLAMAVNNYLLLRGTEVIYVPENIMHFESDEWREEMEIIGVEPKNTRACYLEWIKMVAAPLNDLEKHGGIAKSEIAKLLYAIGRLSGTAQEDVEEAVNSFRS